MTELRDARLKKALEHAPDEAGPPPTSVREAIRAHAAMQVQPPVATPARRAEARPPFWRWLLFGGGKGASMPWNAALATVLVAGFVTLVLHYEETQGPEELRSAAPTAAKPLPTPAPAKEQAAVAQDIRAAPQLAKKSERAETGNAASEDAKRDQRRSAPAAMQSPPAMKSQAPAPVVAAVPPPAPAPVAPPRPSADFVPDISPAPPAASRMQAAPVAPAPASPPAPPSPAAMAARNEAATDAAKPPNPQGALAGASSGAFAGGLRARAADTATRPAAAEVQAMQSPLQQPSAALQEWQTVRVLQGGKVWVFQRGQVAALAQALAQLSTRRLNRATASGQPDYQLELLRDGQVLASLSLSGSVLHGNVTMQGTAGMAIQATNETQLANLRAVLDGLVR